MTERGQALKATHESWSSWRSGRCSALYHLTRLGWTDAVLLERTSCGRLYLARGRQLPQLLDLLEHPQAAAAFDSLYERLAQEVGYDINYHVTAASAWRTPQTGSMSSHVASQARAQHLDFELLSPSQIKPDTRSSSSTESAWVCGTPRTATSTRRS